MAQSDARRLQLDPKRDQNYQGRKLDFLNQKIDRDVYNPHPLQDPVSPFQVMACTVIPASLVTGINSDLPGLVIAQVTENVYDTPTGRYLLIPQGARLIGKYDSVVAFGQSRALVVWNRIVMPDGSSIVIENLPATDTAGYAGLEDEVDYHRSEEHTSELQSLMRISYAVFCLKKKKQEKSKRRRKTAESK